MKPFVNSTVQGAIQKLYLDTKNLARIPTSKNKLKESIAFSLSENAPLDIETYPNTCVGAIAALIDDFNLNHSETRLDFPEIGGTEEYRLFVDSPDFFVCHGTSDQEYYNSLPDKYQYLIAVIYQILYNKWHSILSRMLYTKDNGAGIKAVPSYSFCVEFIVDPEREFFTIKYIAIGRSSPGKNNYVGLTLHGKDVDNTKAIPEKYLKKYTPTDAALLYAMESCEYASDFTSKFIIDHFIFADTDKRFTTDLAVNLTGYMYELLMHGNLYKRNNQASRAGMNPLSGIGINKKTDNSYKSRVKELIHKKHPYYANKLIKEDAGTPAFEDISHSLDNVLEQLGELA